MKILAKTETREKETRDGESLSGCELYRQFMPFEHFRQTHPDITIAFSNDLTHPEINLKDWDLFHFVRKDIKTDEKGTWLQAGNIKAAKDAGLPIVMDIDDLWRLDSTHMLYKLYKENKVDKLTEGWLRDADAVTCTTERLADYISKVNQNVHVIPNAPHPLFNQFAWSEPDKIDTGKVVIGWVGGIHHLNDIKSLAAFFKSFWNNSISDKATLAMGGYEKHAIWDWMANTMAGNSNKGAANLMLLGSMTSLEYASLYRYLDIAIVPLADNAFNKCKSELKIVEAGWFGIPVIAHDIYPYNTVIEHGVNGYLVKHGDDKAWMHYVNLLVNDKALRYEMGQRLKETVKARFNITEANKKRYDLYSGLIG